MILFHDVMACGTYMHFYMTCVSIWCLTIQDVVMTMML
jgi:hypothetical protein